MSLMQGLDGKETIYPTLNGTVASGWRHKTHMRQRSCWCKTTPVSLAACQVGSTVDRSCWTSGEAACMPQTVASQQSRLRHAYSLAW